MADVCVMSVQTYVTREVYITRGIMVSDTLHADKSRMSMLIVYYYCVICVERLKGYFNPSLRFHSCDHPLHAPDQKCPVS